MGAGGGGSGCRSLSCAAPGSGGDAPKTPAAGSYPAVEGLLGASLDGIPEGSRLDLIEHRLRDLEADKAAKVSPVVSQLIERTLAALAECPDFTGQVREKLELILTSAIRFLASRQNAQRGGETSRTAYLFKADAEEKDLEADLTDWFEGNDLYGLNIQSQNIGGGRVDLIFTFDGFRFVIELKREDTDGSVAGLQKHLPQAGAYQLTDIPLGMLMVLDLTGEPPQPIRDNVWVDRVPASEEGGTDRLVVVVRVPGNRVSPSRL